MTFPIAAATPPVLSVLASIPTDPASLFVYLLAIAFFALIWRGRHKGPQSTRPPQMPRAGAADADRAP